ncbi:hypothetical protein QA646_25845 (plasmid) [Rhizobium sp. CB3090]|uniref:hypothetical protein n=1 Tax=Rhizobium sp. CB3090 TaxID=3039156 RepID=UPI0024B25A97|nr:hypothetical protein [Rhizobium sp. CB3090]WFU11805.1 hypothetical protein QA646_25845 [Rhizobium sp. CB3090]
MNMDISRTTEALLAGAGFHTPQSSEADFRIDRWRSDQWKIIVLSPAPAWFHSKFCCALGQCLGDDMLVDILSADRFLKEAHTKGIANRVRRAER